MSRPPAAVSLEDDELVPLAIGVPGWLLPTNPVELPALDGSDDAVPPDCEVLAASPVAFGSDEEHPATGIGSHASHDALAANSR
ncbi:MAG: hypothetical protein ABSC94_03210 [Polyangiaceae bacterium]